MIDQDREFDVVLWGASGFTGRLVAEYLGEHHCGGGLRWALAGRNQSKLEAVRDEFGLADVPVVTADSDDWAAMTALAGRTKVVCTTVGPYALYGTPLVSACVEQGTHYCDLTGEVQWMQRVIEQYQSRAEASGARMVHTCGFDSIPSDLGVWHLQEEMQARHGVYADVVKYRVGKTAGAASGGTVYSILNMLDEAAEDPAVKKVVGNPYALYPAGEPAGQDVGDQMNMRFDKDFNSWTAPFVMAAINTRVVRRSNALLDFPWGRNFRYDESVLCGGGVGGWGKASLAAFASAAGMGLLGFSPTRKLLEKRLPQPGTGPSLEQREKGFYEIFLYGKSTEKPGAEINTRIYGDRDPGYGSTSKMLAEAAVCLAKDELGVGGGFWTPTSAMAEPLLARLRDRAGLIFEVVE